MSPNSGSYDVAEICRNGHVVNRSANRYPQRNAAFCGNCGASTIQKCQDCDTPIRGFYNVPNVIDLATTYTAPGFCHGCGKPYPWTAEKLAAAKELALELENLTVEEQRTVAEALDDVVKDTAKTEVASFNIKRLLTKAGQEGASAMKQILIQIGTAYAKQQMGL